MLEPFCTVVHNPSQGCWLQALDRATLQRLVGVAADAVRARLAELQAEAEAQLDALAPAYALALLQHSAPRQPHQDTLFFLALYEVGPVLRWYL